MRNNILNYQKHKETLSQLISLNNNGIKLISDKVSSYVALGCSKVEMLEAFKKDVDKTSEYLYNSQGIINSIQNQLVTELNVTTDSFFGSTYDVLTNSVNLCGVNFSVGIKQTKVEIKSILLKNLFNIDSKILTKIVSSLSKVEEEKDIVKKAILSPTVKFADEILAKINKMDVAFKDYVKTLSEDDNTILNKTFKRGGIDVVIETSSYVTSETIKQTSKKHNQFELLEIVDFLKISKYFGDCEIDQDGDVKKALKFMMQVERLKLNVNTKFTLKFRKLGNHKANGMYIKSLNMICEDIRETSAMLHEIGHLIHLTKFEDSEWLNSLVERLKARIDLDKVPEAIAEDTASKSDYYYEDTEIVARACEVAALLEFEKGNLIAGVDEFALFKSREFYSKNEGIYFCFNSLDDNIKSDLHTLFDLFYNTSPDEVGKISKLDNFVKQDSNYQVSKKEMSIMEIIRREAAKVQAEQRKLYSMVTFENIEYIFANAECSKLELANTIFSNIRYIGGHNARMTAEEWAVAIEDKAKVIDYIFNNLRSSMNPKNFIFYLQEIKDERIWSSIRSVLNLSGFSMNFQIMLRRKLKELNTIGLDAFKELDKVMRKGIISLLSFDLMQDENLVLELLKKDGKSIKAIDETLISKEQLVKYQIFVINDETNFVNLMPIIREDLANEMEIGKVLIEKDISNIRYIGDTLKQDPDFRTFAKEKGVEFEDEKKPIFVVEAEAPKRVETTKKVNEDINFRDLIVNEDIVDFTHTRTGETLKVLKVKKRLSKDDFKLFSDYLKSNKIGYYSKYAKGFIINLNNLKIAA
jgi:hypothetical protein